MSILRVRSKVNVQWIMGYDSVQHFTPFSSAQLSLQGVDAFRVQRVWRVPVSSVMEIELSKAKTFDVYGFRKNSSSQLNWCRNSPTLVQQSSLK